MSRLHRVRRFSVLSSTTIALLVLAVGLSNACSGSTAGLVIPGPNQPDGATDGATTSDTGASSSDAADDADGALTSDASGDGDATASDASASDGATDARDASDASDASHASDASDGSTGGCAITGLDAGAAPTNTTCATGEAHSLALGGMLNVSGSTAGAATNYPYCQNPPATSPAASSAVVYTLTLTGAGRLHLAVTAPVGSALHPNIDLRQDCTLASVACGSSGGTSTTLDKIVPAGVYHVIVSGAGCTGGAFSLAANYQVELCGNGVVDPGEDCDPGMNPPDNDGCGAPGSANECKFIAAPAGQDQCPGQSLSIAPGTFVLPASSGTSTYGFNDDYTARAACLGNTGATTGGRDRVFQLTPTMSGTLTVSAGYATDGTTDPCVANPADPACWARVLYARTLCASAVSEVACMVGFDGMDIVPTTIHFAVTAGTPYWVFVDGYDDQSYSYGPFNLIVRLQ